SHKGGSDVHPDCRRERSEVGLVCAEESGDGGTGFSAARGVGAEDSGVAVGKNYPEIDEGLRQFMQSQPVFFVATAPLDAGGHVNLSPKGLDTFRILGPRSVAYLDVFGSGVETIAHLRENGRIVVMFCAFQGSPKILRLPGQGRDVEV